MIPYGVYWFNGVAWLVQEADSVNAIGLVERSPFRRPVKSGCPHSILLPSGKPDSTTLDQLELLRRDPVAMWFIPGPKVLTDKRPLKYCEGDPECALYLQSLWSPSPAGSTWISSMSMFNLIDHKSKDTRTNLIPTVYRRCKFEHQPKLDRLMSFPFKNRCVIFGDSSPVIPTPYIERIEPCGLSIDTINAIDLNKVGAAALRQYMRGEK